MLNMKSRINRLTTRILSYIHRRDYIDRRRQRPMEIVWENSAEESAKFIGEILENAVLCETRDDLWLHALKSIPCDGNLIKCGVFEGASINFIGDWLKANNDQRVIDGFDSFEGLEEDWLGENLPAGFFNLDGKLPKVWSNVRLHKGWVQNTIKPYIEKYNVESVALLHIETDTYTSAIYLLNTLKSYLKMEVFWFSTS